MRNFKNVAIICLCLFTLTNLNANDKEEIKTLINEAYVNAIHNFGDLDKARYGFMPEFAMFIQRGDMIDVIKLEDWLQRIETSRENNPSVPDAKAAAEFLQIFVVEDSAMVILELYRGEQKMFTDYFNLYKVNGEWKIIAKTFYRH